MESSFTTSELRATNRQRVLQAVYHSNGISKQGIGQALSMSLPTVTQNLRELEKSGLIERKGLYESTGGRKAQIYRFVATARIAIGVMLQKERYQIVSVDLYGNILHSRFIEQPFLNAPAYFYQLGSQIDAFIMEQKYDAGQLLGVCIALQGLVSADGKSVVYGEILNCTGLTLEEIRVNLKYPCTLLHDTEASAIAELWRQKDLKVAMLLCLNQNFGGTLIANGMVERGSGLGSGVVEHMRLYPGGRPCYCGKCGCMEAYLSAQALQQDCGRPLEEFFHAVRRQEPGCGQIWQTYLKNLAIAINNLRMILDCDFIIGGYLLKYMNEGDFSLLEQYVNEECPFQVDGVRIRRSTYDEISAAPGAAISLIKEFLHEKY